jgi:hypothetical protein
VLASRYSGRGGSGIEFLDTSCDEYSMCSVMLWLKIRGCDAGSEPDVG